MFRVINWAFPVCIENLPKLELKSQLQMSVSSECKIMEWTKLWNKDVYVYVSFQEDFKILNSLQWILIEFIFSL